MTFSLIPGTRERGRKEFTEGGIYSFLHRVAGLSLRDRVWSMDLREELNVESMLLCVERS